MNPAPNPNASGLDTALAALEPGFLVGGGRFTLQRLLGQGGMGVVWLAYDEQLREEVALKFLPPAIRHDAVALDDLRRETARSRKLTHANIIRIHDFYLGDHDAFISMEYVDGPNLSDLRLGQPERVFTWPYLQPLVKQLCEALDYAHGERIVHRDLKPANMMLDGRGRLKLADFGIAAMVTDSASRISMRHAQSGTSTYMSPQQMDGRLPQVADDIYALGATIYELLTSKPPFFTGDIPHQVRNLAPQPLLERLQELGIDNPVPRDVAALVMACLAKDPETRPASARAVAEWIGLQTPTPSAAVSERTAAENTTAQPPKTAAPAAMIENAAKPTATVSAAVQPEQNFFAPAAEAQPHVEAAMEEPSVPAGRSRRTAMMTLAAVALVAAASGGVWLWTRRSGVRDGSAEPDDSDDSFTGNGKSEDPSKNERTLVGHSGAVNSVAFTRDGRTLVSGSADKTAIVWDVQEGRERQVLRGHTGQINAVAVAGDGRTVVTGSDDASVRVWDGTTGQLRHVLSGHDHNVLAVALAAEDDLLATGDRAGRIILWRAQTGQRLHVISAHKGEVRTLALRGNSILASGGTDQGLKLWNTADGRLIKTLTRIGTPVDAVGFSPHGTLLAATSHDHTLRFWDGQTFAPRRVHGWKGAVIHSLSFASAKHIAFGTSSGSLFVWELDGTRRGPWQVFRVHTGPVYSVCMSDHDLASGGQDKLIKVVSYKR